MEESVKRALVGADTEDGSVIITSEQFHDSTR